MLRDVLGIDIGGVNIKVVILVGDLYYFLFVLWRYFQLFSEKFVVIIV